MAENEIKLVIELHVYNHGYGRVGKTEKNKYESLSEEKKKSIEQRILLLCNKEGGELLSVIFNKFVSKLIKKQFVIYLLHKMAESGAIKKYAGIYRGKNYIRYETC